MLKFSGYVGLAGGIEEKWFEFELPEESTKLEIMQAATDEVLKQVVWGFYQHEDVNLTGERK